MAWPCITCLICYDVCCVYHHRASYLDAAMSCATHCSSYPARDAWPRRDLLHVRCNLDSNIVWRRCLHPGAHVLRIQSWPLTSAQRHSASHCRAVCIASIALVCHLVARCGVDHSTVDSYSTSTSTQLCMSTTAHLSHVLALPLVSRRSLSPYCT